jgi:hypothetical protein
MTSTYNPGYTGGVLNLTGVRPAEALAYDGPTFPRQVVYLQTITSSYDAIERLIVPPPLKVDRSMPPEMQVLYFTNVGSRAYDGRLAPYQACMFMAHARHGDAVGQAGWEYVDAIRGDKTEMDGLLPWGVYFGMLKKLADIRFYPVGVNEFEMTVTRHGVRLVTSRFRLGSELPAEDVEAMNAAGADTLLVREFPNETYTGFTERSVCLAASSTNTVTRAWSGEGVSVEFGHLELDPLDELPVLGIGSAVAFESRVEKELFTGVKVLDRLPQDG